MIVQDFRPVAFTPPSFRLPPITPPPLPPSKNKPIRRPTETVRVREATATSMEKFLQEIEAAKPVRFTAEQLKKFTDDYKTGLGAGGFGEVYKGQFPDGVRIAVKILRKSLDKRDEEQFMAEVGSIGRTYHINLRMFLGFYNFLTEKRQISEALFTRKKWVRISYGIDPKKETVCSKKWSMLKGLSNYQPIESNGDSDNGSIAISVIVTLLVFVIIGVISCYCAKRARRAITQELQTAVRAASTNTQYTNTPHNGAQVWEVIAPTMENFLQEMAREKPVRFTAQQLSLNPLETSDGSSYTTSEESQSRWYKETTPIMAKVRRAIVKDLGTVIVAASTNTHTPSNVIQVLDVTAQTMENFLLEMEREKPVRFTAQQLDSFTSNYSTRFGSGGFGSVYKGQFPNGERIAVKVLKWSVDRRAEAQFMAEVGAIGRTYHLNLVRLYGFCHDQFMRALVYEYMENGLLDKYLLS
ncbi:hypothetical protein Pint_12620 [Pistacia integerrima]|uniref:Uncharacterized protein n=1 Tax=Pistacia integerrima TaxID=434235 RepID=A0ACC0Y9D3_9ROSI|nr:hypothetical protein Pint_12620 [Pistacia integerrima]